MFTFSCTLGLHFWNVRIWMLLHSDCSFSCKICRVSILEEDIKDQLDDIFLHSTFKIVNKTDLLLPWPILISFLSPHLFYLQRTYQSPPGILVHICMWCVLFLPCWNVSSIYHDLSSLLLHSQLKCLISHRCLIVVHEWMQIKARSFQKKNSIMETPFSED